jgi:hypothetical protein
MKTYLHPVKSISDANELHLFEINNKYVYVIGKQRTAPNCPQLKNVNCDKISNSCVSMENLLKDWLTYNQHYELPTVFYDNINKSNQHYKNTLSDIEANVEDADKDLLINILLNYYLQLGNYLFMQTPLRVGLYKELTPKMNALWFKHYKVPDYYTFYVSSGKIKDYGMKIYFEALIEIVSKVYHNFSQFVAEVTKLFDILNVLENLSRIMLATATTQIVYTYTPSIYVKYFDYQNITDKFNIVEPYNCITHIPIDFHVDEYRWLVHKTDLKVSPTLHTIVKNFVYNNKHIRGGCILYTKIDNKLWFGFGVDSVYNEYTDFGGKIEKKDKNIVETALRELKEESLNIFDIPYNQVTNNIILYNNTMAVVFIKLPNTYLNVDTLFQQKLAYAYQANQKIEVNGIVWLSLKQLQAELQNPHSKLYSVIKYFLVRAGNFYNVLE